MNSYVDKSTDIYGNANTSSADTLNKSKSEISDLYKQGYTNLQDLVGQQSKTAIEQSLRPIENKLSSQGLIGGPSGALNEALAGAAERVQNAGIDKLAAYQGQMTGALANSSGSTASQLSALAQALGTNTQALQGTSLQNALANTSAQANTTDKYQTTGLNAAIASNAADKAQAGQSAILTQQGDINAAATAQKQANDAAVLEKAQKNYDNQLTTMMANLTQQAMANAMARGANTANIDPENFRTQAMQSLGARPQ